MPSTLETASRFFSPHLPGLVYKVRTVNGGPLNEPTDQIIVLNDSIPHAPVTSVRTPEDLVPRVTLSDVASAIFSATYHDPEAPTKGASTYTVSKSDWVDMFEMKWDNLSGLKPLISANLEARDKEAPVLKINDYLTPQILVIVRNLLNDNDLTFLSADIIPSQNRGRISILLNSSKPDLSEDEQIKMDLISSKVREESKGLVSVHSYVKPRPNEVASKVVKTSDSPKAKSTVVPAPAAPTT
jgi:hypothetical protein